MRLLDLNHDRKARITDLDQLNGMLRRRLMDLGIMEGTDICIKRILPFGGPIMVESNGQWIGIRRREAEKIGVERK